MRLAGHLSRAHAVADERTDRASIAEQNSDVVGETRSFEVLTLDGGAALARWGACNPSAVSNVAMLLGAAGALASDALGGASAALPRIDIEPLAPRRSGSISRRKRSRAAARPASSRHVCRLTISSVRSFGLPDPVYGLRATPSAGSTSHGDGVYHYRATCTASALIQSDLACPHDKPAEP
jgi:hypothetical protein